MMLKCSKSPEYVFFFFKVTRIVIDFYVYAHADLPVSIVSHLIVAGTEILYVNHVAGSLVLLLLGC